MVDSNIGVIDRVLGSGADSRHQKYIFNILPASICTEFDQVILFRIAGDDVF